MMDGNKRLCHGKDFVDFKYYPKFLGLCLRRIQPGITIDEFLQRYKLSQSLAHDGSLVPQILRNIRDEIKKDLWETLEQLNNN